jgi:PASTA domain
MLSAAATTVGTLSWWQALSAAGVLSVVALLAGLIVIYGRNKFVGPKQGTVPQVKQADGGTPGLAPQGTDGDFIRSWTAIILVIGLVVFCAFAFAVNDTTLRSTLIGGLIASVGSAVAFYFSSKAADKARQDIANAATFGTDLVPCLIGKTQDEAAQILGKTSFSLIEDPGRLQSQGTKINAQNPAPYSNVPRGSSIVVTLGALRSDNQ